MGGMAGSETKLWGVSFVMQAMSQSVLTEGVHGG